MVIKDLRQSIRAPIVFRSSYNTQVSNLSIGKKFWGGNTVSQGGKYCSQYEASANLGISAVSTSISCMMSHWYFVLPVFAFSLAYCSVILSYITFWYGEKICFKSRSITLPDRALFVGCGSSFSSADVGAGN